LNGIGLQPYEVLFSVTFSILNNNVFRLHKIHTNRILITKYKLFLLRYQNTKLHVFYVFQITCISITTTRNFSLGIPLNLVLFYQAPTYSTLEAVIRSGSCGGSEGSADPVGQIWRINLSGLF